MKVNWLHFALLFLYGAIASAANLAVIDSGVDYKHKDLANKLWTNPNNPVMTTDDEGTVYKEDLHGWNFAEKNNQIIDYKYLHTFSPDCTKVFDVQGKVLKGTATEAEKAWYKQKKEDPTFLKELGKFGNFVHGTHVSGISSKDADQAHIAAMKLIATEPPGIGGRMLDQFLTKYGIDPGEGAGNPFLAKLFLGFLAKQQAKMLTTVGRYTKAIKADVANGSFGTSVKAAKPIVAQLLEKLLGHKPSEEEAEEQTKFFVGEIVKSCATFTAAAPDTLFVFAAGNDGTDNDALPASPANVKADNTIAVAATLGTASLASFSNFGAQMVEVAAPGVTISSSIPGDEYLEMSGTSMAAPFVTNVAGIVKDANPSLPPKDIKRVIMETVDVKGFLSAKVKSSGIVNRERAKKAAVLSTRMGLTAAIAQAKTDVADMPDTLTDVRDTSASALLVFPLPSTLR